VLRIWDFSRAKIYKMQHRVTFILGDGIVVGLISSEMILYMVS